MLARWLVVAGLGVVLAGGAAAQRMRPDGATCYGTDPNVYTYCVPPAEATRQYGAIAATSGSGDFYGYAFGWSSRGGAEREALAQCNKDAGQDGACEIAVWFYNQCAALAQGADGAWGADYADNVGVAAEKALKLCRENDDSGACKVVKSFCSR